MSNENTQNLNGQEGNRCHKEPSEWARAWVHILISELGRQRQENCTFEASLGYMGSFRSVRVSEQTNLK